MTKKQPKIHGNLVNIILIRAYQDGGKEKVREVAAQCLSDFSDEQLMEIATEKAVVAGNNIDGLTITRR